MLRNFFKFILKVYIIEKDEPVALFVFDKLSVHNPVIFDTDIVLRRN